MLAGNSVQLRPVEREDLPLLVQWRNEPDHWACFFNKFPLSMAKQDSWFDHLLACDSHRLFMICTCGDLSVVGTIGLNNIDFANQSVEFGNMLIGTPDARGKGYAKEATDLMLAYCFKRLNMNRVYLHVYAGNRNAIRLYEHCGFQIEGTLREAQFEDGQFQDLLIMSVLRRDL